MQAAERVHSSDTTLAAPTTSAPAEQRLPAPFRQALLTQDAPQVAKLLREYQGGDVSEAMSLLQQERGNAFVQAVLAVPAEAKAEAKPSMWTRLKGLEQNGSNKLFDFSAEGKAGATADITPAPVAEAAPASSGTVDPRLASVRNTATSLIGDRSAETGTSVSKAGTLHAKDASVEHKLATTTAASKIGDASTSASGTMAASANGIKVGGNAGASATLLGAKVAIHSKPMSHTLFGEQVSAQFHLGVDAAVVAEAKGDLGLDVAWTGMGARAHLAGAGNGTIGVTGAATLTWAKKSPTEYAQRIAQHDAWRGVMQHMVPGWLVRAVPEDRVAGWLSELIQMVIADGGGDAVVLGASTTASARGSLGLPQVGFAGGSVHVGTGAGLSFGGANASVDLELGRARGLELLSVLAFSGSTALMESLNVGALVPAFLKSKVGAEPTEATEAPAKPGTLGRIGALHDKAKSLDGDHRLLDVSRGNQGGATKEATTKGEGHDFTYTRSGGNGQVRTGDDARKRQSRKEAAAIAMDKRDENEVKLAGTTGTVKKLAEKALGSTEKKVASAGTGTKSVKLIEETTIQFGGEKQMRGDIKGHALHAEAAASGEVGLSAKQLRVGGNASASAYLVAGQVHIETPELSFDMFGERVSGKFNVGMDAGAFAEAAGNVNLNVGWKGGAIAADLSGFVGAKAGITAAGKLSWSRKSAAAYADKIVAGRTWTGLLGGIAPAWVLNSVSDKRVHGWMENLVSMLTNGGEGDALVLGATARAEGSVGIGAAGSFNAGFRGGVLHCHGRGGLTFGVGAGATVDLALGMLDGMGLLAVLTLQGATQLGSMIKPPISLQTYLAPKLTKLLHG